MPNRHERLLQKEKSLQLATAIQTIQVEAMTKEVVFSMSPMGGSPKMFSRDYRSSSLDIFYFLF